MPSGKAGAGQTFDVRILKTNMRPAWSLLFLKEMFLRLCVHEWACACVCIFPMRKYWPSWTCVWRPEDTLGVISSPTPDPWPHWPHRSWDFTTMVPMLNFFGFGFSGHTLSFILGCRGQNLAHPASNLPTELSPGLRHKFKFTRTESVEHHNRMVSPLVQVIYEFEVSWFHRPRLKRIKK